MPDFGSVNPPGVDQLRRILSIPLAMNQRDNAVIVRPNLNHSEALIGNYAGYHRPQGLYDSTL